MRTRDFHFDLPEALIAQRPLAERTASRLLVLPAAGPVRDLRFADIEGLLRPGDLLVLNNTRVIPARLFGRKESGGRVEVLLERVLDGQTALAHVRASKAPRPGTRLLFGGGVAEVVGREAALFRLRLADGSWQALLEAEGHVPLPPYIRRGDEPLDRERYQTVYAREAGAVAAPTAGLHFSTELLARLRARGVETAEVTLHVGAGTFQPVRVERIEDHRMHAERVVVPPETCARVDACRAHGGRVVAVGTTSVRSLETAAADGTLRPFDGESRLFITPGYRFRVVDLLLTNFHLPESTLLMLVCAFGGHRRVMEAYRHAVAAGYRFFSYGDAMLLERNDAV